MKKKPNNIIALRPAKSADNFAWLKANLSADTKRILRSAARFARAFDSVDNMIQPEFILAAVIRSTSYFCQDLTADLCSENDYFKPHFVDAICATYDKDFTYTANRLQNPRTPQTFAFSQDTKAILRSAVRDWAREGTDLPVPLDYILSALFTYRKPLEVLDAVLHDFDFDRADMISALMSMSKYFNFNIIDFYPETEDEESSPENSLPYNRVAQRKGIAAIEKHLRDHLIGQPRAIAQVVNTLKRSMVGLKSPSKPIGIFMFAGYTGVGKTEFARQLSSVMGLPMLRLDMSEYSEKHTVSRLYGSPPGYIGHDEGGQLTNFIAKHPDYSLIVFDELEKAHPDIFDVLLQIAEEGTLTDTKGKVASFHASLIILTTNIGSREALHQSLGFGEQTVRDKTQTFHKAIRDRFKPELLGRIGQENIIIFNQLDPESLQKITKLELAKLEHNLASHRVNIKIRFSHHVVQHIISIANTSAYGARDIAQTISNTLSTPLSDFFLTKCISAGQTVSISYNQKDGYAFQIETPNAPPAKHIPPQANSTSNS